MDSSSETPVTSSAPAEANPSEGVRPGPPAPAQQTAVGNPPAPASPGAEPAAPPKKSPALEFKALDAVLVTMVLALAFLLGSFAVNNFDAAQHLAVGRLLAQGEYSFGVDPIAHTTAGVYWVNHAWLFDLGLYGLYQLAGGPGVVVARALLVTLLALVLLRIRRPGTTPWIPVVCATLGLLVMSQRFLLQPAVVSLLMLGVTFFLLHKGYAEGARLPGRGGDGPSVLWLLPPLFALWVNLDAWFVLGPLVVALYLAGAALEKRAGAPGPVAPRALAGVLAVGLLACLLNPHLHRAFVLPPDLAYLLAGVLPTDAGTAMDRLTEHVPAAYLTLSPFGGTYWRVMDWRVAGVACYPLLGLGLFGFIAMTALPRTKGPLLPFSLLFPWAFLAVLSAINFRVLGFFAVVAAPVLTLLLQDLTRRPSGAPGREPQASWLVGGRVLTGLGFVLLLFFAWPGQLHPTPDDPRRSRRVAWEIHLDPSLPRAGEAVAALLATGKLTNGFNYTADAAYALAWHVGPKARTFFDYRFALFPDVAEDFGRVRRALRLEAAAMSQQQAGRVPALGPLHKVFRAHKVNYLVLTGLHHDTEAQAVTQRLLTEPAQWPLLYADGRTAVFGWRDPQRPGNPFAGLGPDFNREAFGAVADGRRPPADAPPPPQAERDYWRDYATGRAPVPPAAAETVFFLMSAEAETRGWRLPTFFAQLVTPGLGAAAGSAVVPAYLSGPLALRVASEEDFREYLFRSSDVGPPALPTLAVRSARRAVADNPESADAYSFLADAYRWLLLNQEEHWDRSDPQQRFKNPHFQLQTRRTLRLIQYLHALQQAARLDPTNPIRHQTLAELFHDMGYLDAALEHLDKALEAMRAERPRPGREEMFSQGIKQLEAAQRGVAEEVRRREKEYYLHSGEQRSPAVKFGMAVLQPTRVPSKDGKGPQMPRGLALLGLKELREIKDVTGLKPEEQVALADSQMVMMLLLGQTAELREFFEPDLRQRLRGMLGDRYDHHEMLFSAAVGDYRKADAIFAQWDQGQLVAEAKAELLRMRRDLEGVAVTMFQPQPLAVAGQFLYLEELAKKMLGAAALLQRAAELRSLRGLLALEQGDTAAARRHFEGALDAAGDRIGFPSRRIAQRYLECLQGQRQQ